MVVLTGDPQQLGPVIRCGLAQSLSTSLLERICTSPPYSRDERFKSMGMYNPLFITKLVENYRSHPSIIERPSTLFYDAELVPQANPELREIFCNWKELPTKNFPLIFHGVQGQDMREGNSPSWFNPQEVAVVVDYIQKILASKLPKKISEKDIGTKEMCHSFTGIVTPYRKQSSKFKECLKKLNLNDIKVGSVEEFQGQERTIIILSTVRSTKNYLAIDNKHNLGFLSNPKRFNVAVTRAKALLIVVGNPYLLSEDKQFNDLLGFCKDKGGYVGCHFQRKEELEESFIQHMASLRIEEETSQIHPETSAVLQELNRMAEYLQNEAL